MIATETPTEETQQPAQSPEGNANQTPAGDNPHKRTVRIVSDSDLNWLENLKDWCPDGDTHIVHSDMFVMSGAVAEGQFIRESLPFSNFVKLYDPNDPTLQGQSRTLEVRRNGRTDDKWLADKRNALRKICNLLRVNNSRRECVIVQLERTVGQKGRQHILNGCLIVFLPTMSDPAPTDAAPPLAKVAEKAVETGAVVQHEQIEDA